MLAPGRFGLLPRPRTADLSAHQRVVPTGEPLVARGPGLPAEGYRLRIVPNGQITIDATDDAGVFYARATLDQLRRGSSGGTLPIGVIEDWPDIAVRGVMLDVSRCRVPTLETLCSIVERLASWKVNHLQLYMEHTFAYTNHLEVWEHADPYTADDLARLARHCRAHHIELAPNQNTLGHMERWLLHERYAGLGISRGVVTSPLGLPIPASTLDPSIPGSLSLVRELAGELAGALGSAFFNVGLDEPWDLPSDRSHEWATWVRHLRDLPALDDRQLLVWGDMLTSHPELIGEVPDGVTVCEWGYDQGHPFAERMEAIARAGVPVWVSPGTSSWLSIVGRTTNAVDNCREAALAAGACGATGLLVTDWGDFGHHQGWAVSEPGLAAAAAFSWCAASNADLDAPALGNLLDIHSFGCLDDGQDSGRTAGVPGSAATSSVGTAMVALGDLYRLLPFPAPNLSALTLHLYLPQLAVGAGLSTGLTTDLLDRIEESVEGALNELTNPRAANENGTLAVAELCTGSRLVQLACRDARGRLAGDGLLASIPDSERSLLAGELEDIVSSYRTDWLARDRPGGLDESCAWLEHLRQCYLTGSADPGWGGPMVAQVRTRDAGRGTMMTRADTPGGSKNGSCDEEPGGKAR